MTVRIIPVFCNEKNMANYAYILTTPNTTIIIDAAEATPIINELEKQNLAPTHILTTHHHYDHVGGNVALKQKYNLKIVAPAKEFSKVPAADIKAEENKNLALSARNIPSVKLLLPTNLNVKDLLEADYVVMTEAAVKEITERLS